MPTDTAQFEDWWHALYKADANYKAKKAGLLYAVHKAIVAPGRRDDSQLRVGVAVANRAPLISAKRFFPEEPCAEDKVPSIADINDALGMNDAELIWVITEDIAAV